MASLNLSWHRFGPFPHILPVDTREKHSAPPLPLFLLTAAESSEVSPLRLLLSKIDGHRALRSSSQDTTASPVTKFVTFSGHIQGRSHPFWRVGPRSAHSTQGESPQGWMQGDSHLWWLSARAELGAPQSRVLPSGCRVLPSTQRPASPDPSLQGCPPATLPFLLIPRVSLSQMHNSSVGLFIFHATDGAHCCNLKLLTEY